MEGDRGDRGDERRCTNEVSQRQKERERQRETEAEGKRCNYRPGTEHLNIYLEKENPD